MSIEQADKADLALSGGMMSVTRDQALEILEELNVAAIFVHAYLDDHLPDGLELYFRPPEEFFIAPDSQELYTQGRLIPLLDSGSFSSVLFYDPSDGRFVDMVIEDPGMQTWYANWDQYLASVMFRILEYSGEDLSLSELKSIAERIEFKFFEDALAIYNETTDSYKNFCTRRDQYIEKLNRSS